MITLTNDILFDSIELTSLLNILPYIIIAIITIYVLYTNKNQKTLFRVWFELFLVVLVGETFGYTPSIFLGIYFLMYDLVSCKRICQFINIIFIAFLLVDSLFENRIALRTTLNFHSLRAVYVENDYKKAILFHKIFFALPKKYYTNDKYNTISDSSDIYLAHAKSYYFNKEFEEAIFYFKFYSKNSFETKKKFHEKLEALIYIAKSYKKLSKYNEAIRYSKKAIDYAIHNRTKKDDYYYEEIRNYELLFELSYLTNTLIEDRYISEYNKLKQKIEDLRSINHNIIKMDYTNG